MLMFLLLALAFGGVSAFTPSGGVDSISYKSSALLSTNKSRRIFLSTLQYPLLSSLYLPIANAASVPVQQAVGSAESKCREEGNCLEKGELDGAVGWNWGGTERCDAREALCGPDGRLREEALRGQSVPTKDNNEITDIVELALTIGTGSISDSQIMKIGLYGNECPNLVKEFKDLCSRQGLVTSQNLLLGAPVRLSVGGSMTYIRPEERLEFGVASQKQAYAKSIRRAKAPEEFVPQGRPDGKRLELVRGEQSSRKHDVAGLLSLPKDGIGYGSFGLKLGKDDDEAYSNSFEITAKPMPEMDKEGRKVIGQLLDATSMDLLARLSGSPTRKLIPTQTGGTPLIKVSVDDCSVSSVADLIAKEKEE